MRVAECRRFPAADGTELFYRYWPANRQGPTLPTERKAVILLHRGHEHSGRLQVLADELQLPDCDIFAWDARGHGRSPGARGYAPDVATLAKDLDAFAQWIAREHGIPTGQVAMIAQSVGAVIAACWVHDYAPPIRAMVLAAPAFKVKLYIPFALPALRLAQAVAGNLTVYSYVKARFLTHDADRIEDFERDPLIAREIASRLLVDLDSTSKRLVADAAAITVPTQILLSGSDWVVKRGPQLAFFRALGSDEKEIHTFPGFFHDTLGEKHRHLAIAEVRRFVVAGFAGDRQYVDLRDADKQGFSCDEFQRLRTVASPWRPAGLRNALMRTALRAGALLSDGIRLGFATGFDSGASLDYVYRNEARGRLGIGRMIDRAYLNSAGWRGIRVRRQHLQQMLERTIEEAGRRGRRVRILDVAAGHGRYVLDVVERRRNDVDEVLLRDFCENNVLSGRQALRARGMEDVARFEQADAFQRASFASPATMPRERSQGNQKVEKRDGLSTIAIVSGLYELFPENEPVRESLTGIASTLEACGFLIYTGQPWHPQLAFIASTLPNHRGEPWVMRRRTQAELDQLVAEAGFRKVDQVTDRWGMFTVSLAQRVAP